LEEGGGEEAIVNDSRGRLSGLEP